MKYVILLLILLVGMVVSADKQNLSGGGCLPINFMAGATIRAVRDLDIYQTPDFTSEIVDSLLAGSEWILESGSRLPKVECVDGVNWLRNYNPSGYIPVDTGEEFLVETVDLCPLTNGLLSPIQIGEELWQRITFMLPSEDGTELTFGLNYANGRPPYSHPAIYTYQTINMLTGEVRSDTYPYADVVTRELTDQLGITDEVFGERSHINSLIVSPDSSMIYFRDDSNPISEFMAYRHYIWDGEDIREVGGTLGWAIDNHWSSDGYLYQTVTGPYGEAYDTNIICMMESCPEHAEWNIPDFYYDNEFYFKIAFAIPSPSGRYLSIIHSPYNPPLEMYPHGAIVDLWTGYIIPLFVYSSVNSYIRIIWWDDDTIIFPANYQTLLPGESDMSDEEYSESWTLIDLDFDANTYTLSGIMEFRNSVPEVWYHQDIKLVGDYIVTPMDEFLAVRCIDNIQPLSEVISVE